MIYVYPKFPEFDLIKFRIGGCGLGNLLFIYSKALIYAKENNYQLIWPTWTSLKIGTYIRREKDKRLYNDLFVNGSDYIDKFKKFFLLTVKRKIHEKDRKFIKNEDIVIFDKKSFNMSFRGISEYKNIVYDDIINNLSSRNKDSLECDFRNGICAHIRLGDFKPASEMLLNNNINNVSTPIQWYVQKIIELRNALKKDINVYVFSDGDKEQLFPVLELGNVQIVDMGTSIGNILALSKARLMLASGSSTSMWARFLGDVPTIAFTNQLKERIQSEGFEEEVAYDRISKQTIRRIQRLYSESGVE